MTSASRTNVSTDDGVNLTIGKDYEVGTPVVLNWKMTGLGAPVEGWIGTITIPVSKTKSDVSISRYGFFDPEENDDGIISPGESGTIDIAIRNTGSVDIRNLTYRFSTESDVVTITAPGPFKYTNTLKKGSTYISSRHSSTTSSFSLSERGKGEFRVSRVAEPGSMEKIDVLISDGINTWEKSIYVQIKNPDSELKVQKRSIIDSGNGDGIVNIGETGYLDILLYNDGESDVDNITATLSSETEGVIITKGSYNFGSLRGNSYKTIRSGNSSYTSSSGPALSTSLQNKSDNCFSFRIAGDAEEGERAELTLTLSNGYQEWEVPITFIITKPTLGVDPTISLSGKDSYELVYPGEELKFSIKLKNTSSATIESPKFVVSTESEFLRLPKRAFSLSSSISKNNTYTYTINKDNEMPVVSASAPEGSKIKVTFTFSDLTGAAKEESVYLTVGKEAFDPVISNVRITGLDINGNENIVPGGYAFIDAAVLNRGPESANVRVSITSSDPALTVNTRSIQIGDVRPGYSFVLSNPSERYNYSNRGKATSGMIDGAGAEIRISPDAAPGLHEAEINIYADGVLAESGTARIYVE